MGVSTNGQICFGIVFEGDHKFPWDKEHDGNIESWWRDVNGYKPPFVLYDEHGNYAAGIELLPPVQKFDTPRPKQEVLGAYYDHRREWEKANPVPAVLVNYCSGDYPMYILAVPSTGISCLRGSPTEITPAMFHVSDGGAAALKEFCEKFGIPICEPKWWLSSYWG